MDWLCAEQGVRARAHARTHARAHARTSKALIKCARVAADVRNAAAFGTVLTSGMGTRPHARPPARTHARTHACTHFMISADYELQGGASALGEFTKHDLRT